ncbi:MAG: sodium-translocating pyrophosphatase [Candidatus Aenigmarchaeota archaeon]|nr:sodium-translocating pyrophosphatase [Candidatus Aenigmarchaeota archaeon]
MLYIVWVICILSLGFAGWLTKNILKQDTGQKKMREIADAIRVGSEAYLRRQSKTIAVIAVLLAVLIAGAYSYVGQWQAGVRTAAAFLFGAFCSGIAAYFSMWVAVRANIRTAAAAQKSLNGALQTGLRSGLISGIVIVTLSLLGVLVMYSILGYGHKPEEVPFLIVGFGFGASLIALFCQLGGGIYTKAADVGADLVGKIEAGIPEDDPRNPAVIADLVGDNVGDCAGRGADIFESTAAETIGAMIIGVALFPKFGISGIFFPLVVRAVSMVASIIGVMLVSTREKGDPMKAMNKGYFLTNVLIAIALYFIVNSMLGNIFFYYAALVGIVTAIIIVYVTIYYTESVYRPVKGIAKAATSGHAMCIIQGFAYALECTALPVIVLSAALLGSYTLGSMSGIEGGGLFGTAVATMGMLASAVYILAMDNFGPIADNAGGIAEMSGVGPEVRKRTDRLDAVGNTTKALTKGYAIGTAALAAFLLFAAYLDDVKKLTGGAFDGIDISKVPVFVGGFIGAMLIYLFSSIAIRAVSETASSVVDEVRRQFKTIKGLMEGTAKPDYARCVDICTKAALKQMILPGLLVVVFTVAVGLILRAEAVGAFLIVGTISGILMALVFNTGGGAWDNAKKHIETGAHGGKGSEAHKAAVTGDTVGDPFKDTAGPSLHVLIKLLGTITLVLAALFV